MESICGISNSLEGIVRSQRYDRVYGDQMRSVLVTATLTFMDGSIFENIQNVSTFVSQHDELGSIKVGTPLWLRILKLKVNVRTLKSNPERREDDSKFEWFGLISENQSRCFPIVS